MYTWFMSTDSQPEATPHNTEQIFFTPRAFDILSEVATGIDHDRRALGMVAVESGVFFGPDYGLTEPYETRTLVYRYAKAGTSRDREPSIEHAPSDAQYYPATQLADPQAENRSSIEARAILATGPVLDMWLTERSIDFPMVRNYVHALLYPKPEDSGFLVSGEAWKQYWQERFSRFSGGPDLSDKAKARFMDNVLVKYSNAITLDLRP